MEHQSIMNRTSAIRQFALAALLVGAIILFVFRSSFSPNEVLFSNDSPLGSAKNYDTGGFSNFQGIWTDLNWLGTEAPSGVPDVSNALFTVLGSLNYAKFYCPI